MCARRSHGDKYSSHELHFCFSKISEEKEALKALKHSYVLSKLWLTACFAARSGGTFHTSAYAVKGDVFFLSLQPMPGCKAFVANYNWVRDTDEVL